MSAPTPLPNLTKVMLEELITVGRTEAVVEVIHAEYSELVKEELDRASNESLIPPDSMG